MPKCEPILLEPINSVEISVPNAFTARVQRLVSGRRGQILGYDAKPDWPGWDVVSAHLPQSELHDLIVELRSLTMGVGSFAAPFRPYAGADRPAGGKGARRRARRTPRSKGRSRNRDLARGGCRSRCQGRNSLQGAAMLIRRERGWELRESEATPETVFLARRTSHQGHRGRPDPRLGCRRRRPRRRGGSLGRASTRQSAIRATRSTGRSPTRNWPPPTTISTSSARKRRSRRKPRRCKIRPWTIKIDGLVEKPLTLDIDDLLKKMPLEERLYRHRCVEAWSMAVPWSGFPMAALVDLAKPLGSAKYVQMETFIDPEMAPGQKAVLVSLALCRRGSRSPKPATSSPFS